MRAPRYPLHLAMFYKGLGELEWRRGRTVNISSSGVLFQVDDLLAPGAGVEFRLVLPVSAKAGRDGEICGQGHVVRQDVAPGSSRCAMVIDQYDFQPGSMPLPILQRAGDALS
jgi:hypothetical protein